MSDLDDYFEELRSWMETLKSCKENTREKYMNPEMRKWLTKAESAEPKVDELAEALNKVKSSPIVIAAKTRPFCFAKVKLGFGKTPAKTKLVGRIKAQIKAVKDLIEERKTILDMPSESLRRLFEKLASENPQPYRHSDIENFTKQFSEVIGFGAGSSVYKGQNRDGVPLAIKVLRGYNWDMIEKQLEAEVVTMGRTHHRNLIKLYGFCYNASMKALVFEYMENGSLDVILSKNHLGLQKLYSIAIGIAKGISYLHDGCNPQIIHFDVKPANVLLDADFCPKLTDFCLSMLRIENSELTHDCIRGTLAYMAPEMAQQGIITCKCDVYSFGMILFNILASKRNCAGEKRFPAGKKWLPAGEKWLPGEVWEKFQENQLDNFITDYCGIKKEDEVVMAKTLATVALLCAENDPEKRPSMNVVASMLEGNIQPWKPHNPFPNYNSSESDDSDL